MPAFSPPHPAPYTLGAEATFGAGDMLPAILPTSSHHSPLSGVKKRGFHRVQGFARAPHLGQPRRPSPTCCALCQGWRGTQRQCGFVQASTATGALTPETLPHRGQAPWGGAHPGKQAWSSHEVGGWGAWQLPQGPACCGALGVMDLRFEASSSTQTGKLRPREGRRLASSHTANLVLSH